ncbi:MAG TPA: M10 family metallopeptidase [Beijerinckiaceae bacterium]|nr:M10 family metallopeptidase [Beijerinckiaceae bacterium]
MSAVNPSGNQNIDGILWGYKWDMTDLTYSFPSGTLSYAYDSINGFETFNFAQRAAVHQVMANTAAVCGLTLTHTTEEFSNFRFAEADAVDYGGANDGNHSIPTAEGNPPDPDGFPIYAHGDCWFNRTSYNAPVPGNFAYSAGMMHELGHALGLKHGHVTQFGHGILFPMLPHAHDGFEFSVMTYHQFPGDPDPLLTNPDHPTTWMQNDIAALQYLYGANFAHNAGNTVYSWSPTTGQMFVNGSGRAVPETNLIFMTIWDGGGTDTYNLSNYRTNLKVDLNPGGWTITSAAQLADLAHSHTARGNIANALLFEGNTASLIENAIGGSGNDYMVGNVKGNQLAGGTGADRLFGLGGNDALSGAGGKDRLDGGIGNDVLIGGADCDTLIGGYGRDVFDFNSVAESRRGSAHDTVYFRRVDGDKIDLSSIDADTDGAAGNQAFRFIGAHAFTGVDGQLRFSGGLLQGDTNGDRIADIEIKVIGALVGGDVIL